MLRQELARRNFLDFCKYVMPGFIEGPPQRILADVLERVYSGEIKRLMVSMPPRHGKSLMATQLFPCWVLGKRMDAQIIQTTYAHSLSVEHSREARKIFISNPYLHVFPGTRYAPGREGQANVEIMRQAAEQWGTTSGGNYYAVGVGGGLTGRGADYAIIDDPVKNREEANSEIVRGRIADWYRSTLYTRLSPEGAIILVMTRWHPDDLVGSQLSQIAKGESNEEWTVISMPAISDIGEPLWPERWPLEKLALIKNAIGQYEWNSLYQCKPVLRGGNMLQIDRIVSHKDDSQFPKDGYVRVWDLASTEKERKGSDPDSTAGALAALTIDAQHQEHYWLRDLRFGQWDALVRENMMVQTARDDGPGVSIGLEAVGGYTDSVHHLRRRLMMEGVPRNVRALNGKQLGGDKVARATPIEAIMEAGCFHILEGPWNDEFLKQASEFPTGTHDDLVDAPALAYREARRRMGVKNQAHDVRKRLRI